MPRPESATTLGHEVAFAEPEEGEVPVVEPGQQRPRLLHLGQVDPGRRRLELGGQVAHALAHRLPVLDRGAHLSQHAAHLLAERLELVLLGLAVDLDMQDRLGDALAVGAGPEHGRDRAVLAAPHPDHGMDHQVQAERVAAQLHAHRVDDERHVVADDLHHRVRRLPPVLLELRVVDAHLRLAGLAPRGEVPVRERGAVDVERAALEQIVRRHPAVVLAHELLDLRRLLGVEPLVQARADGVDQRRLDLLHLDRHGCADPTPWGALA
jgi:hypothetical protein